MADKQTPDDLQTVLNQVVTLPEGPDKTALLKEALMIVDRRTDREMGDRERSRGHWSSRLREFGIFLLALAAAVTLSFTFRACHADHQADLLKEIQRLKQRDSNTPAPQASVPSTAPASSR